MATHKCICMRNVLIFLLLTINISFAQNFQFKNFSTTEGLVHKRVYKILRDSDGFVWAATAGGLSRFDSYTFNNFAQDENSPNALQGTAVYGIAEGKNKKLWLSTDTGLESFDKQTETFHLINHDLFKDNVFNKDICVDEQGIVWLFNQKIKFVAYAPQKDSVLFQISDFSRWGVDEHFSIHHFHVIDSTIWIASNQGVASYNLRTQAFSFVYQHAFTHCHSIDRADENTLVFTYMYGGIYVLDIKKQTGLLISKDYIEKQIGINTALFGATIDADSTVWISVAPGIVSINASEVNYYNYNSRQRYFDGDVVSTFLRDTENNLWVGTYDNGIYLKAKNNDNFTYTTRLYKGDIIKTLISSFDIYDNGSLLYADTRGIYYCKDYKNLSIDCAEKIFTSANPVIFPLDNTHSLISNRDTFLIYNSEDRSINRFYTGVAPASVFKDTSGIIWTGTWHGYVQGYREDGTKLYEIPIDSAKTRYCHGFSICGGGDGSLWIGSFGLGLVHIIAPTSEQPTYEYYNKESIGSRYINTNTINCLFLDKNQNLWIGTSGAGLIKRDAQTSEITAYTTQNGLKSNVIESIISDENGNIWFASNVLSKFDAKTETITHYSNADGIKSDFVVKGCSRAINGDLIFANSSGISVFDPLQITQQNKLFAPLFTNLRINGMKAQVGDTIQGKLAYSQAITYIKDIALPYSLNTFAVEFASINFHEANLLTYEYKLEGVDRQWIPTSPDNRIANYTGIDPGEYRFTVRSSLDSEKWTDVSSFSVRIIPPWWRTLWFQVSISMFLIIGVSGFLIMRFRNIKQLNTLLEQKVQKRTEKLTYTNNLLKENHLVLEMKNDQLNEALSSKDKLIKVIAHDFKNPLSAIHGLSTLLRDNIAQYEQDKIKKFADSISNSSLNLSMHMQNVLDWALAENQEIAFKPKEINIETLISDALELVKESVAQKEITVSTEFEYQTNSFVDPRMINTVIRNLLINAIKFTPKRGSIAVSIQELENEIEVSIIDSGVGISEEAIQAIFNTNESVSTPDTENKQSTGLGLKLSKQFIEANGGTISAQSRKDRGAVFSISVPKGKMSATKKLTRIPPRSNLAEAERFLDLNAGDDITILLIDDNKNILNLLQGIFEKYYTVVTASDGQSGMQMATNMVPSLIISDISMPKVSGIDLCQSLKGDEITSHIPIILLTANQHQMNEGYACGADDFIVKPFIASEIIYKVHSLLENRKRLLQKQKGNSDKTVFILPESYEDTIMQKILAYINEDFSNPKLDSTSICKTIGLSRTQLWRKFKSATDQNLSDYIRDLRLEKAKIMLLSKNYKVSEVAYEVGFSNPQYFSKCFSKFYGYAPKDLLDKKE